MLVDMLMYSQTEYQLFPLTQTRSIQFIFNRLLLFFVCFSFACDAIMIQFLKSEMVYYLATLERSVVYISRSHRSFFHPFLRPSSIWFSVGYGYHRAFLIFVFFFLARVSIGTSLIFCAHSNITFL